MEENLNQVDGEHAPGDEGASASELSYKFQRLRERLRQAVTSGELSGKLPGERILAKRYHVNAKTLSKALTDLAAEGILDRSIGRGTYVKGSAPLPSSDGRWLILCDPGDTDNDAVRRLLLEHPDCEISTEITSVRPSYLNQFRAVIDFASKTPESLIRDMVVRNIPVVNVCKDMHTFSTHAVQFDTVWAVSMAGRDLLLGGHRNIAFVEKRNSSSSVAQTLRTAIARYSPKATADVYSVEDISAIIDSGATAILCDSAGNAARVRQQLQDRGIEIPGRMSLIAVGGLSGEPPCSGYFIDCHKHATAVVQLLAEGYSSRPTTIWLSGEYVDRGTVAPLVSASGMEPPLHFGEIAM